MNSNFLSLAIWVPILGAIPVLLLGSERRFLVRWLALAVALAGFAVTLPLYTGFDATQSGMQFVEHLPWVPRLNLEYLLGVDGISMPFILLNSFITIMVVMAVIYINSLALLIGFEMNLSINSLKKSVIKRQEEEKASAKKHA